MAEGLAVFQEFIARGLAAQRAVDTILHHTSPGGSPMAQAKTPRKNPKAFGGYQISFAGRTDTVAEVFGAQPLAPSEMTKRLWAYVKKNRLASR